MPNLNAELLIISPFYSPIFIIKSVIKNLLILFFMKLDEEYPAFQYSDMIVDAGY